MKRVVIALVGLVFLSGSVALAQDAAKIAAGKKAFADKKCSTCHAVAGQGGKTGSALDKVGTKLSADDIKKWLTDTATMEAKVTPKPKVSMAGFMKSAKLTDADVDALVAYMQSLK
ncbi:MAG TPA: cytochrome c [Vicinamibacterales bacterium]|nr:cytochrome c [Vicinamibacterales bacterium]